MIENEINKESYAQIKLTKKLLLELKGYEKNNKIHPEIQKQTLKEIIEEVWYDVPIIIDKYDVIVAGHCRLEVLKLLWYEYVDVIVKDKLSEKQIRKYRLLDNKIAELAQDHIENIHFELEELEDMKLNELYEFNIDVIDPDKEAIEDDVPEIPTNIIVEKGDIFQLWEHRLMCGDSTNIDDVEKLMDWEKADMVFTDPPYWMHLDTSNSNNLWWKDWWKNKAKNYSNVIWDWDDFTPSLIETVFDNFWYCKEIFLWWGDYFAEYILNKNDWSWIVWDKRFWVEHMKLTFSEFELCWSKTRHLREFARITWSWILGTEQEFDHKRHHPTQKPIKLVKWFLDKFSKEKELIVDIYWWSGATLLWCAQVNRKCYMMELDEKYIQVILKRYHTYTDWKKEIKCLNRTLDLNTIYND